jgi:hypothetical protein
MTIKYAEKASSLLQMNDASPQMLFNATHWGLIFQSIMHQVYRYS